MKVNAGIATIEFYNEKANCLSSDVIRELIANFEEASDNKEIRAIILRSGGEKAFCGGASFTEMRELKDKHSGIKFFSLFADLFYSMVSCPKPIIARVQGQAVGGGVGLIAASDYSIAYERAGARLSELAIGLGAIVIEPFISVKTGKANFLNMSLDCELRSASQCLNSGLFSQVVDSVSKLDSVVEEKAKVFSNFNLNSFSQLKKEIWGEILDNKKLLKKRAQVSGELVLSAKIPI